MCLAFPHAATCYPTLTETVQNLNEALGVPTGATPERTVTGLCLLKGGLPHFDVEVSAGTPLAEALAVKFGLPDVLGEDPEALRYLQQQSDSQRETTKEELEALFSPSELVGQTTVLKVPHHGGCSSYGR